MQTSSTAFAVILTLLVLSCGSGSSQRTGGSAGLPPGTDGIDGSYALSVATELASEPYGGRQAGSEGSRVAREYLAAAMRAAGLQVEERPFPWRTAFNEGDARLEVSSGSHGDRVFLYRKDFREVVRGGYEGGKTEGPLFVYADAGAKIPPGAVVLLPDRLYDPDDIDRFRLEGAVGLLVELESDRTAQR
ncbi:MAG: hypothetical protein E4H20_10070, partial [Spirochaetales bacterium]